MKIAQIEANESLDDSESSLILDSEDISVSESWLIDENVVSIFFFKSCELRSFSGHYSRMRHAA